MSRSSMWSRSLGLGLAVLMACAFPANSAAQHQHDMPPAGGYGSVHFSTSCSAAAQPEFERGVAIMHSFGYEKANGAFTEVAQKDPQCAMAWWGVAMTQYHGLWRQIWPAEGHAAVEKARAIAKSNAKTTDRERGYIEAIANIFDDASIPMKTRELAYEAAMAKLHAAYPDDHEAAIFYALALDVNSAPTDKTYANQRKARDILVPIFKQEPNHPGLAHYIIHTSDFPPLAADALDAARHYAAIAPASPHAQHMPSHIFTRLGLWEESIASNSASAASAARDQKTSRTNEAYNQRLHAMDYLEYAYLQTGRMEEARQVMEEARSMRDGKGLNNAGGYGDAAIPTRYALERHDWKMAAALPSTTKSPANDAMTVYARGMGAARLGNVADAKTAEAQLAAYRDELNKADNKESAQQVEVERLQVASWIAFDAKNLEQAVREARASADLEDSTEKSPVTPGAIIPARENLAELLVAAGKPAEALPEFEAVLRVAPRRYNAIAGAGKAAAGVDPTKARFYEAQLQALKKPTPAGSPISRK